MADNLRQKTVIGVIWAAIEKFGVKAIAFVSNIILARLLSPDDYGCIGMLMVFILLAMTIVEGGFASSLIQKKNTTKEDESTIFYWNIVLSVLLYILLYISAHSIAVFYEVPKLEIVLQVQGLMLLLNAFGVVQLSLLRKELKFKQIAIINTISAILSVAIALVLAFSGYGIWALVWQQTSQTFFSTILAWFYSDWRPSWSFSFSSLGSMFQYGSFLLLSNLLNTLCENLQGLIIGKLFSSASMGYYSQAKKLEEVPTMSISQVVSQVTFPVFSRIQEEKNKLYTAVRQSLLAMNFFNIPLMALLIVIAEPLFIILFSEKWLPSVPYFQILCFAGLFNCSQSVNYQVVVAVGKSKETFYWNIIKRSVGVILMVIGSLFGNIESILWSMVLGFIFTYVVNALVAQKVTGYYLKSQVREMIPIFIITIISSCFSFYICSLFKGVVTELLLATISFIILYLILSYYFCSTMFSFVFSLITYKINSRHD